MRVRPVRTERSGSLQGDHSSSPASLEPIEGGLTAARIDGLARFMLAVLFLFGPLLASGATISVTAVVPAVTPPTPSPAKVVFKGLAYPSSLVTIQKDGVNAVVVPADPAAKFEIELGDLAAGTYTFSVFGADLQGRIGRASNFTLSLTLGTTVTLSGIFLGPTIAVDKTSAQLGETVTLLGATAPESSVSIVVSSETEHTFKTSADQQGLWVYQFVTDDLGIGTHSARVKAVAPTNEVSAFSDTVSFSVTEGEARPCDGKRPGDLNCDGKVNLVDFSILLFYWKKRDPENARADINADGIVNIRDLSILLFWWTK